MFAQVNEAVYTLLPSVLGILGLLALNALLTACEISLIRLRYSHFNPQLLERLRQTLPVYDGAAPCRYPGQSTGDSPER